MRHLKSGGLAIILTTAGLILGGASAFAASETEGNDTFATRNSFAGGTTTVDGTLELPPKEDADFTFSDTLGLSGVNSHSVGSQSVGATFLAEIDNLITDPDGDPDPDTVLGRFGTDMMGGFGSLITVDDDSSRFGDGFASGLAGSVNSDGTINLKVSGFFDFDFDGGHFESGSYDLFIFTTSIGDVDFLSFTGLTPGDVFEAQITAGTFDTVLGLFDDTGAFIRYDDDGGVGTFSKLTDTVDSSGNVHLAVSAFDDSGFDGTHLIEGRYTQSFNAESSGIPEPATLAIFGIGLAGLGFMRRRRVI